MQARYAGKVAMVTGGSQGIGASVAARLAAEGATVGVVASRDRDKAEIVCRGIAERGGVASAHFADVRHPDQLRRVVEQLLAHHGRLDVLVNAAGVFFPTPAGETGAQDCDRMVEINLTGSFHAVGAVVPAMRKQGGGRIVLVASVAGVMGIGGYALYSATKAGVIMMTRALAVELAPHGISVNAVAPGNTATPMNLDLRTRPEFAGMLQAMTQRTPSGRTYSAPEDIAAAVLFAASEDARAMHGATIVVDEGFSAGG